MSKQLSEWVGIVVIMSCLFSSFGLYAQQREITEAEYYWNKDPGFGNGTMLTITQGAKISKTFTIPLDTFSRQGLNRLNIRVKNSDNLWSHVLHKNIFITGTGSTSRVSAVEYFWDTDPGFGQGNQLTVSPSSQAIDLAPALSTTGLTSGLHRLMVRVKDDNGYWSHAYTQNVFIMEPNAQQNNIVAAEYFIGQDPGFGQGNSIAVSASSNVVLNTTVDLSSLSTGIYRFYARVKDQQGTWSHVYQTSFLLVDTISSDITEVEYFWDADPGFGNAIDIAITPGQYVDLASAINSANLNSGIHTLYVRSKNSKNQWSHTYSSPVFVMAEKSTIDITNAEYFWNSDPGFGNGQQLSFGSDSILDLSPALNSSNLSTGVNNLYVRFCDEQGQWSHTYSAPLFIQNDKPTPTITQAEYFWNSDPGAGQGNAININSPDTLLEISASIDNSQLGSGLHHLYIRTGDENGQWSHTYHDYLYINQQMPTPDIVAAEYYWDADPGYGQGTGITVASADTLVNLSDLIQTNGLNEGLHRLNIRTKNDSGLWSHDYYHLVYIREDAGTIDIVDAEYFWDADPGHGQGTPIAFSSPDSIISEDIALAACNLSSGDHLIFIRTKDENRTWSHTLVDTVSVTNNGAPAPLNLSVSNNSPVCKGDSINLSVSGAPSGADILWSGPKNFVSKDSLPFILDADHDMAGTYQVVVMDICHSDTLGTLVNVNLNTWTGGVDDNWDDHSNWTCYVPKPNDDIIFDNNAQNNLVLDKNRVVDSLDFRSSNMNLVLGNYDLEVAHVTNFSKSSFIKTTGTGVVKSTIDDAKAFKFPVGNTEYNPLEIENNTGSSDAFSVKVRNEVLTQGFSGNSIASARVDRTWDIEKQNPNTGNGVNLTFHWQAGHVVPTIQNYAVAHYDAGTSTWGLLQSGLSYQQNPTPSLTLMNYTGLFSPFAVVDDQTTFPVELLSFDMACVNNQAVVSWSTASEINNDRYVLKQSTDMINWTTIAVIDGQGNSNQTTDYQNIIDDYREEQGTYFQLSQFDYDGHSEIIAQQYFSGCDDMMAKGLEIYPNPGNGNLTIHGAEPNSKLVVLSETGQALLYLPIDKTGSFKGFIDLPKGIYFIRNVEGQNYISEKLIII